MKEKKKTILFLLYRECSFLPPFMTILDCLKDDYTIKVISRESSDSLERLNRQYQGGDVKFLIPPVIEEKRGIVTKITDRIQSLLHKYPRGHKECCRLLETIKCDLIWVIHENTAYEFKDVLIGKKYLLSLYELNDHRRDFLEQIKPVIKGAREVFVPEYNRGCILRVWLQLDKTPTVIQNKPLNHPMKRNLPNPFQEQLAGKKIVLYQGYINRSRNLNTICDAIKDMPEYCIVLMGKGDESYIKELLQNYPNIIHISFITPPEHLNVTSWAHIAIVKYDFVFLNAIYCAPNKTWEYTGFGIPVLCHNIPGLEYTIGAYDAGICADLDNIASVKEAICKIDSNYDYYKQNALSFFESCDIDSELHLVARRNSI